MSIQHAGTTQVMVKKVMDQQVSTQVDKLAIEEPLEIRLSSPAGIRKVSVTMRTPGNDEELAIGFLFTEGILRSANEVASCYTDSENTITVKTAANPDISGLDRNFYTTSSCGVCGKASVDAIRTVSAFSLSGSSAMVSSGLLAQLPHILRSKQRIFEDTGGLHASALFTADGDFQLLREDVGRHNALDKLVGAALMEGKLPLDKHILLLSGRASFELVQKAAMAGITIVAAVGAPSSLAVSLAREMGMTLIGFLRDNRFNIYTASNRIIYENQDQS